MCKKMRKTQKLRTPVKILGIATLCLGLQACSTGPKVAMDYLPDTAKVMIDRDIQRGYQDDPQEQKSISVRAMLASILGLESEKKNGADMAPLAKREPISVLNLNEPAIRTAPRPGKKPVRTIARTPQIIDVIDLPVDTDFDDVIQTHAPLENTSAEISIGPLAEAESAQMASLQAMAKANTIGATLREKFQNITIKFNPLQPLGTVKITIKGEKKNA